MRENRFLLAQDVRTPHVLRDGRSHDRVRTRTRSAAGTAPGAFWTRSLSADRRRLVVLIENGGVDLGIPELITGILSAVPGGSLIPDDARAEIARQLRERIRAATDTLLESAELAYNRYSAAKPDPYGDVVVLRDSTASYEDLASTLTSMAEQNVLVDLLVLTHGSTDYISVRGGIDGARIRALRTRLGRPVPLRTVYMINCIGASLNQAWLDAGAKASCGTVANNYLPEPTLHHFFTAWKAGQSFEAAATAAYRRSIVEINAAIRAIVSALPVPGSALVADRIDVEALDVVRGSAPVVSGQRTVTITTDDLAFGQSVSGAMATTVLPVSVIRMLTDEFAGQRRAVSSAGTAFIARWESTDHEALAARIREAAAALTDLVSVPLTQNQIDALASLVCGIGVPAFRASHLIQQLNAGSRGGVAEEWRKWTRVRSDGRVVESDALRRRREEELALFDTPAGTTVEPALPGSPAPPGGTALATSRYESPSTTVRAMGDFSLAQNPGFLIAGIEVADALQIGLGAVSVGQAAASGSQGTFTLTYPQAQRLLTSEARAAMPGAQTARRQYSAPLMFLGTSTPGFARAQVIIVWEGNPYGEIGTPVIRRDLADSTEWTHSSATITIMKLERIPLPGSDPRTWPIVFSYDGTYDPVGNGYFEFSGEFEVNAFGGLKFNRHQVVSRAALEVFIGGSPEEYVRKGDDVIVPVPAIPAEQVAYLRSRLP